ncbi:hypothetical protein D3C86_1674650 [compost metagenome]
MQGSPLEKPSFTSTPIIFNRVVSEIPNSMLKARSSAFESSVSIAGPDFLSFTYFASKSSINLNISLSFFAIA